MSDEIRLTIEGQEYYRGNRSPAWFAVNGGLAERTDDCYWPVFERIAELERVVQKLALQIECGNTDHDNLIYDAQVVMGEGGEG